MVKTISHHMLRSCALCALMSALLLSCPQVVRSADQELPESLNLPVEVPSFYIRTVTGPLRNRSVCYTCRFGARPVVMVALHRPHPRVGLLMRNIDRLTDQGRERGVRSFAVWISESNQRAVSNCQTFAFNERIRMPMGIIDREAQPELLATSPPDVVAEVVLYQERQVVGRYPIHEADLTLESLSEVARRVRDFSQLAD